MEVISSGSYRGGETATIKRANGLTETISAADLAKFGRGIY